MDSIFNYITTKKPYDYEDIDDDNEEEENINTKQILNEIENEQNIVSDVNDLPSEPPKLERQEAAVIIDEPVKPVKQKRPMTEKKKLALEKARLARAEKTKMRKLREQAEKEEKDRDRQFRREAIMLEKLQPMIDDAIRKSLTSQKVSETSTQRHPNIIQREKETIKQKKPTPEIQKRINIMNDEEEKLALLRKALGY